MKWEDRTEIFRDELHTKAKHEGERRQRIQCHPIHPVLLVLLVAVVVVVVIMMNSRVTMYKFWATPPENVHRRYCEPSVSLFSSLSLYLLHSFFPQCSSPVSTHMLNNHTSLSRLIAIRYLTLPIIYNFYPLIIHVNWKNFLVSPS